MKMRSFTVGIIAECEFQLTIKRSVAVEMFTLYEGKKY